MDAEPVEPGLTSWLAAQGDVDREQVAAELEVGARRRTFVVDELVEAGFEGAELLALTMGLTGLDTTDAQALIAARTGPGHPRVRRTQARPPPGAERDPLPPDQRATGRRVRRLPPARARARLRMLRPRMPEGAQRSRLPSTNGSGRTRAISQSSRDTRRRRWRTSSSGTSGSSSSRSTPRRTSRSRPQTRGSKQREMKGWGKRRIALPPTRCFRR